jgi:hypothetical protein
MCQLLVSWVCDHCDKVKTTPKAGLNDWCKRSDLYVQLWYENLPVGKKTPIHFQVEAFGSKKLYYSGRAAIEYNGVVNYLTVQDSNHVMYYAYSYPAYRRVAASWFTCNTVLSTE